LRILGLDYGDARIGLAISDPLGVIAGGLKTIEWKGDIKDAVNCVMVPLREYGVKKVVVGFPRNMNGTLGQRAQKTQEFINLLEERSGAEIIKWDERLTSKAADRTLHELGIKPSKKKASVDRIAAVFILQGYLDSMSNEFRNKET